MPTGGKKEQYLSHFMSYFQEKEYLEISKTFDNSKQLVKLPCSLQKRECFQICIQIARGSIRNHSCTDFWRASGRFFLKTFPLLPAAPCFITLDKFTVLKSPHKCFVNCSILSGSSLSLSLIFTMFSLSIPCLSLFLCIFRPTRLSLLASAFSLLLS